MANSLLIAVIPLLAALALNFNLAASSRVLGTCRANGHLRLQRETDGHCSSKSISNCCEARNTYARYHCSPPVKRSTPAIMTFNSFTRHGRVGGPSVHKSKHYTLPILRHARTGMAAHFTNTSTKGDGSVTQGGRANAIASNVAKHGNNTHQRGMSKCDNKYHDDTQLVVALSTGWYNGGRRCLKNIRINGHGKSVMAKVVDECDSANGCDPRHGFRVPCANNMVDASPAVWKALGIPKGKIGNYQITWSDVRSSH